MPEPVARRDAVRATLRELVDRLDNYVISFVVLAVFWIGHLRVMRRLREPDTTFTVTNLAFAVLHDAGAAAHHAASATTPRLPRAAILYGGNLLLLLALRGAALAARVPPPRQRHAPRRRGGLGAACGAATRVAMAVVLAGIARRAARRSRCRRRTGLAPWFYLLLIAAGIVRPPRRGRERA